MGLESLWSLVSFAAISIIFFQIITYTYNIYFHPLKDYPGPYHAAASHIPLVYHILRGNPVFWTRDIHDEYDSDVVRVAPNELSYRDARAWKDIYGHRKSGEQTIKKSPQFYEPPFEETPNLVLANDETHSRMRRIFSNAFSDRALKQQEPLFLEHVDKLISVLRKSIETDPDEKFDMVKMYNYTTFDLMGDLTFGEGLHLLDGNKEMREWMAGILNSMIFGAILQSIRYFPMVEKLLMNCIPQSLHDKRLRHQRHSNERVDKRLKKESTKPDIWNLILKQDEASGLSLAEMYSNADLFMLAGTETTATLLSGVTFYLLKNPDKLKLLTDELRTKCKADGDLTLENLAQLKYMHACLEEGLRMYPPVPNGLVRTVPPGGAEICGQYVPPKTNIYASHYCTYRNSKNFRDPYEFIPERWTSPEYDSDIKSALAPFSIGPRNCLGQNLAYHQMRVILAKTLWHFDLSLCSESENWADQKTFILWSKGPLMCKLKPRSTLK
ncbi:cytochrome P450 [Tothia fuscella]|uniref:Cytochrome P450 n=1 Tax=Tothia fuscella TaxID=1048955 RepID=A0A9P4NUC4_9PEZI|nr:cytochrome P450 [Tothia fuscella]